MALELHRNFIVVPLMGMLGVFNGILYVALYWKIAESEISLSETMNSALVQNLLGLSFLLTSD
jgi:hypothetical protein